MPGTSGASLRQEWSQASPAVGEQRHWEHTTSQNLISDENLGFSGVSLPFGVVEISFFILIRNITAIMPR